MFQREVAERLTANPGSKDYGRLSVMAQTFCDVSILSNIGRMSFVPSPDVDSSMVYMVPRIKV